VWHPARSHTDPMTSELPLPATTALPLEAEPSRARRAVAGPVVAGVSLLAALIATDAADVPLRDPRDVTVTRLATASGVVIAMVVLGAIAARVRGRRMPPVPIAETAAALISFYVAYFAYRNLKSIVPLLRPHVLFDRQLLDVDRHLAGGRDPGEVLHSVLGTGAAADALSGVYMLFFAFIPLTLGALLVFHRRDHGGAVFLVTALSVNWGLAAASYFMLPSIGPFHAHPDTFAGLPDTPVHHLQTKLLGERSAFLADPSAAGAAQSIGAFASLHVSIYVTAAIGAHLLGLKRAIKIALWTLTGLTAISTVYFGWHYLPDDAGGVVIAVTALGIARLLTGWSPRRRPAPEPV
jgi:hypothetical protein